MRGASRTIFAVGVVACVLALLPYPVSYPSYFDADGATQGIFINDLSFHGDYTRTFRSSNERQDLYRADWAAQRLPFSIAASAIAKMLGLAPFETEGLLRALSVAFAIAGSWFAASSLARGESRFSATRLAIFAFALVHPSLVLFYRTGASFIVLAFALVWGAIYAAIRFSETQQSRYLVGLVAIFVFFALDPYPPLVCLPLVLGAALAVRQQLGSALRDLRVYGAAALAAIATLGAGAVLGVVYEGSVGRFAERITRFQAARGGSFSAGQLVDVSFIDKLQKWIDQHFLFIVDGLGDPTRTDAVWTLNAYHAVFLGTSPLLILGALAGLRAREIDARTASVVLGSFAAVFFTVSFPEGRYTLALVPCYGYFWVRGWKALLHSDRTFELAVGCALGLLSLNTLVLLATVYAPFSDRVWREYAAIGAAAPVVARYSGEPIQLHLPEPVAYGPSLYYRMSMTADVALISTGALARQLSRGATGARLVVAERDTRARRIERLVEHGLTEVERRPPSGEADGWVILTRP